MRVAHLVEDLDAIGGVTTYLSGLLPGLHSRGIENVVLSGSGTADMPTARVLDVPAIASASAKLSSGDLEQLRVAIHDVAPTIVYSHTARSPAVVRAAASEAAVALYAHDYFTICPGSERYLHRSVEFCSEGFGARCVWRAYTERTTNRRPDRLAREIRRVSHWQGVWPHVSTVLVASPFVARVFRAAGITEDRIKLVPYPIHPPQRLEAEARVDIAYVGRLTDSKGVHVLLRAVEPLEGVTVTIAGDGPERARLEALTDELGIRQRVRFAGWITGEQRDRMLAGTRVFAMPSLWDEPFGIVGVEALAAGVPVVASAVGGIPSWLDDGETGFLVARGDVEALSSALRRVLESETLRIRFGQQGQLAARRFSLDAHIDALLDSFQTAVE